MRKGRKTVWLLGFRIRLTTLVTGTVNRRGKNLNQRDTIAVRRMVDGYLKLLYPDGNFTKEDVTEVLER